MTLIPSFLGQLKKGSSKLYELLLMETARVQQTDSGCLKGVQKMPFFIAIIYGDDKIVIQNKK